MKFLITSDLFHSLVTGPLNYKVLLNSEIKEYIKKGHEINISSLSIDYCLQKLENKSPDELKEKIISHTETIFNNIHPFDLETIKYCRKLESQFKIYDKRITDLAVALRNNSDLLIDTGNSLNFQNLIPYRCIGLKSK